MHLKEQKLTNFQKEKEKKDFSCQKNKLGLSLKTKKGFFGQKIDQYNKKKTSWG